MTDYSKMSDLVINGLVMDAVSDGNQYHRPGSGNEIELLREVNSVELGEYVVSDQVAGVFDPCNSWADAGPIAEKNFIGLVKTQEGWCSTSDDVHDDGIYFVDEKPCRAICIVFLMMNEGE